MFCHKLQCISLTLLTIVEMKIIKMWSIFTPFEPLIIPAKDPWSSFIANKVLEFALPPLHTSCLNDGFKWLELKLVALLQLRRISAAISRKSRSSRGMNSTNSPIYLVGMSRKYILMICIAAAGGCAAVKKAVLKWEQHYFFCFASNFSYCSWEQYPWELLNFSDPWYLQRTWLDDRSIHLNLMSKVSSPRFWSWFMFPKREKIDVTIIK